MSLDTTNVLFSLIFLQQRRIPRDRALAAAVGSGLIPGPVGLVLPAIVARGSRRVDVPPPPIDAGDVMVKVPDVVGKAEAAASDTVEKNGLRPVSSTFFTNEKDPGIVVQQEPEPGKLARTGSDVDLVVARVPVEPEASEDEKENQILEVVHEIATTSKETLAKVEKCIKDQAPGSQSLTERSSQTASATSTGKKEPAKS
jgi:hypothetical protein